MTYGMAGLVLLAAIIILFSADFGSVIQRILKLPGMKLFLPLLALSIIIIDFLSYIEIGMDWLLAAYAGMVAYMANYIKFRGLTAPLINILVILLITLVPSLIVKVVRRQLSVPPFEHHGYLMFILWLTAVCLYIGQRSFL